MANTLLINKLTGGYFQFVLNGDTANAVRGIKNDLLAVGEQLHFKTGNGANIIKEQFIYPADLTIVASGTFTFTNVDQVWTKLIEIGYFDWINSGGSGSGASRFDDLLDTFKYTGKDGQVVIVNESQQKLQTVELYNYRTFTDLEDTPDLLLANKMVATNEAGTALIFKSLPEDPVNYLNSIGFFDYNDLATQTTAISVTANTDTKLTNDTLGAYTNINYPPYGVSSLWDATTNRFNFTQLSIGDTIDVRIHLQVTTTTSNQSYRIGAKFGIGSASAFDNVIFTDQAKTAGVQEVSFVAPFYIGESNILNNPAELYIHTDSAASVKVDGWYIRVLRRNINIVNVETGVDDATTTVKGILRLAGDLAGNATNPTVPALADKALKTTTITINGTTFDLSANREWTISAAATWGSIGGLLSNQTDLQSALNLKANDNAVVKLTGDQNIGGNKFFQKPLVWTNQSTYSIPGGHNILTGNGTDFTLGSFSQTGSIHREAKFIYEGSSTSFREYILPSSNGTLALLSDVNSKLNLTGGTLTGTTSMNGGPSGTPPITMIYDEGVNRLLAPVLRLYGSTDISSKYIELDGLNATANRSVKFPDTSGNAIVENLNGQTGFGTIPKGIGASKTIELGSRSALYDNNDSFGFVNNGYNDGAWKYKQTGYFNLMAATEGQFVFYTAPSGAQNTNITLTERFRITQGGNVVVANLGTGTVYSNSGTLTNTNPSDERLKENIEDLGYGLNEILQLRPVSYNWINDTANQGTQFGFIAQEVQEIMPELINEFTITEDDEEVIRLGLDKEAIFVTLVNAIKELKAEIELLKQ